MYIKTIPLSVTTDYVQDWGFWEMFREFAQNALDADGTSIVFDPENNAIFISNNGLIPEAALLYGGGTKTNDELSRGKHCEGLKNALLVAVRERTEIEIFNGSDKWNPIYTFNEAFGESSLQIEVSLNPNEEEGVTIILRNVSDYDMSYCQESFIDPSNPPEIVFGSPEEGYAFEPIEAEQPKLYVGGLLVGDMPKSWWENQVYRYSYNMPPALIGLDRDRNSIDNYKVQRIIADILIRNNEIEMLVGLGYENALDVEGYSHEYTTTPEGTPNIPKSLGDRALELFYDMNGENAYPIDQGSKDIPMQKQLIEDAGLVPVLVPRKIYSVYVTKNITGYGAHLPQLFVVHEFLAKLLENKSKHLNGVAREQVEEQLKYINKYYPQ